MGRSVWQDGRRAWQRLNGWHQENGASIQSEGAAMKALGDIRLVRGLLDQAEMGAVRAARREGRSWGEIATMLGVARQSAWERWRDLVDLDAANTEPADVEAALDLVVDELMLDRRRTVRRGSVLPIRSRVDGDRGMLAVRFESERGDSYISFWGLERGTDGWRLSGGSYSSRLGEGQAASRNWLRSGGWGSEGDWCFGGILADPSVHRVQVETGGGSTVVDVAEEGVALVIARDGNLSHATVDMFDASGRLVSSGQLFEPRR